MKKIILLLIMCFVLSGCSLLKVVSAPFKNTVTSAPKSKSDSKQVMKCKGELEINNGIISCSDGFYFYEKGSREEERNLTLKEKISQWISKTAGWFIILIVLSVILTASGFGWIISLIWNSIFGLGKVLRQIIKGVQAAKNNGSDFVTALNASTDEDVKRFIAEFKLKNGIK